MKCGKEILLFLFISMMEMSWLCAWAVFTLNDLMSRPFPLLGFVGTFSLSALFTRISTGKGWRIIYMLLMHLVGLLFMLLWLFYIVTSTNYEFANPKWVSALIRSHKNLTEWGFLTLILFWGIIFWMTSWNLTRKPFNYRRISAHFDLGLSAFFILFILKLLLLRNSGIDISLSFATPFLFSCILFGLLSLGGYNHLSNIYKDYLPGFTLIGLLSGFIIVLLLLGMGSVSFLLPYLTMSAEAGYGVLKKGAEPLAPILIAILRFLFMGRQIRSNPSSDVTNDTHIEMISSTETTWWGKTIESIAYGSLMVLVVLGGLTFLCFIFFLLLRWLVSKTGMKEKTRLHKNTFFIRLMYMYSQLVFYLKQTFLKMRRPNDANCLWTRLKMWGKHSGIPRLINETPREYGARLKQYFPRLGSEIDVIILGFNREIYGAVPSDVPNLLIGVKAWHTLRNPRHWPSRLKHRILLSVSLPGGKHNFRMGMKKRLSEEPRASTRGSSKEKALKDWGITPPNQH